MIYFIIMGVLLLGLASLLIFGSMKPAGSCYARRFDGADYTSCITLWLVLSATVTAVMHAVSLDLTNVISSTTVSHRVTNALIGNDSVAIKLDNGETRTLEASEIDISALFTLKDDPSGVEYQVLTHTLGNPKVSPWTRTKNERRLVSLPRESQNGPQ